MIEASTLGFCHALGPGLAWRKISGTEVYGFGGQRCARVEVRRLGANACVILWKGKEKLAEFIEPMTPKGAALSMKYLEAFAKTESEGASDVRALVAKIDKERREP